MENNQSLISGVVQKIMLQMTWVDQTKDTPVCVGIIFSEDKKNPKRYIMSLNEKDFSDWKKVREQNSLSYDELVEIIDKLLYAKVKIYNFKDKSIPDIFWISEPIEIIKNSDKPIPEMLQKYYNMFINTN